MGGSGVPLPRFTWTPPAPVEMTEDALATAATMAAAMIAEAAIVNSLRPLRPMYLTVPHAAPQDHSRDNLR